MSIWVSFSEPVNSYFEAASASTGASAIPTVGGITRQTQVSDFSFTKTNDDLSQNLRLAWAKRTVFESVWVEVYEENASIPYLTYKMADVRITSYQASGATESLQLKASKLEVAYW